MPEMPKHSVSVAGVVINDRDQVLLIQRRDNGHWEPPGGILELDEEFHDGVRREVLEETGVTVEVDRLTGVYKNLTRGIVALVFRCRAVAGEPQATDESVRVEWLDLGDAVKRMDEAFAIRVSDAFTDAPTVRSHNGVRVHHSTP